VGKAVGQIRKRRYSSRSDTGICIYKLFSSNAHCTLIEIAEVSGSEKQLKWKFNKFITGSKVNLKAKINKKKRVQVKVKNWYHCLLLLLIFLRR